jgi:hypothetical protein
VSSGFKPSLAATHQERTRPYLLPRPRTVIAEVHQTNRGRLAGWRYTSAWSGART